MYVVWAEKPVLLESGGNVVHFELFRDGKIKGHGFFTKSHYVYFNTSSMVVRPS